MRKSHSLGSNTRQLFLDSIVMRNHFLELFTADSGRVFNGVSCRVRCNGWLIASLDNFFFVRRRQAGMIALLSKMSSVARRDWLRYEASSRIFNETSLYFIRRSVLHSLSTSPNEIKASFIESLFVQSIRLVSISFFANGTLLFSPENVWHFASQGNQSTVTTNATTLNTQPESAVKWF